MAFNFANWTSILMGKLSAWWVMLISMLPNFLLALVVIILFFFLARVTKRLTFQIMPRIYGKQSINSLFSNIAYMLVILLGLFVTLNILNLNQAVSSLMAGAGIIGLVLGFAFQDLSSNFISGIFIAVKRPFEVDQTVETNGYIGNIEDIQLRSTTIRTFQGLHLMIPNKDIFQKPFINYSRSEERRIELEFAISPDHNLRKVYGLCIHAIEELTYIVKTKPVEVYYTGFGENQIKIAVWFWIFNQKPPGFMVARHDAIMNLVESLNQNNVTLISPITYVQQEKKSTALPVKDTAIDNHQNANA